MASPPDPLSTSVERGRLAADAAAICGPTHVLSGAGLAQEYPHSRGGPPCLAVRPATTAEVQALVQLAASHQTPVVPWGSGSRQTWGAPRTASRPLLLIDLRRVTDPWRLDPDNLTATVGAGRSLADLDRLLAPAGLRWPVERLDGLTPTVGGTVATAAAGPSRRAIGPTARWVLGIEAVTAQGEVIHAGGQTVKNVAGYDLTRLLVGSWGALGLITAVILRLAARPAVSATALLHFDGSSAAAATAAELADHPLGATAVELWGLIPTPSSVGLPLSISRMERGLGGEAAWALLVRAEGGAEQVDALLTAALDVAERRGGRGRRLDADEAAAAWRARARAWRPAGPGVVAGTWSVPHGGLAAALTMLPQIVPECEGVHRLVTGHAGDGLLHLALVPAADRAEAFTVVAAETISRLRSAAAALGGSWRTEVAPSAVWTTAGSDPPTARQRLFERFRAAADPTGLLALPRRW